MNAQRILRYSTSIVVFIALWWISTYLFFNPKLVPPPSVVADTLWGITANGELFGHVWASLRRVVIGYLIGSIWGIAIGVLIGMYKIADDLLEPPLQFVRNITPVAVVPLAIHAFGLDEASKYFVIWYGTIIPSSSTPRRESPEPRPFAFAPPCAWAPPSATYSCASSFRPPGRSS